MRFAERHKPHFACCSLMWDETGERLSLNVATRLGLAFSAGCVLRDSIKFERRSSTVGTVLVVLVLRLLDLTLFCSTLGIIDLSFVAAHCSLFLLTTDLLNQN